MLDALESEYEELVRMKPSLCVEIGSGSGCNISFLASMLKKVVDPVCIGIDINPYANKATVSTALENGVQVDVVRASMSRGLRFPACVDVLIFNPPYVPSEGLIPAALGIEDDTEKCLEAAWAGGVDGRYWIDILLPQVKGILSPRGFFYMVAVRENRPVDIMRWAWDELGLRSSIVIDRRARNEHLFIIKFSHK